MEVLSVNSYFRYGLQRRGVSLLEKLPAKLNEGWRREHIRGWRFLLAHHVWDVIYQISEGALNVTTKLKSIEKPLQLTELAYEALRGFYPQRTSETW